MEEEDKVYKQFIEGGDTGEVDNVVETIFLQRKTKHADDAIDYEDIDELADDDLPEEEPSTSNLRDDLFDHLDDVNNELVDHEAANQQFDDMFGDEDTNDHLFNDLHHDGQYDDNGLSHLPMEEIFQEEDESSKKRKLELQEARNLKKQKLQRIIKKLEARNLKRHIRYYYPSYSRDKPFNYHLFFLPEPRYYRYQTPPIAYKDNIKPLVPTKLNLEVSVDTKKLFKSKKRTDIVENKAGVVSISQNDYDIIKNLKLHGPNTLSTKQVSFLNKDWSDNDKFVDFSKELILSTTDWNDDDIINAGDKKIDNRHHELLDIELENEADEDIENIFNGQINEDILKLDMNDPNLIFIPKKKDNKSKAIIPTNDKLLALKFNISNDKQYEILKNNYIAKVRSQLSNLNIEHSIPALRLQSPYYKVKLTKEEARSFHRPRFNIRPGTLISFSKLRIRKKKKDRNKTFQEIFAKTSDLTATDTTNLIGMEYSEECPQILSNFGMGSKIINYYRKEMEDDTSRPKAPIGETHVLGVEDRSPFWNFGEVAPGDFVPTLYNNMIRAPIFKHNVKNTDFLFIRSQGAGSHQKNYLRNINFMFSVGNIFPAVEVPAPHSRKVTNASKNRLKMVVFRVMNNKNVTRVAVKDFSRHFPDQNDMQNRQRLKEFMEYQRQGEDQGFWKIKNMDHAPSEIEIRSMLSPEDSSLLDSMQHGQQILEDTYSLYGNETKKEKEKKEDKKEKKKKDINDEKKEKEKVDKDKEKESEVDDAQEGKKDKEKVRKPRDTEVEIDVDEELAPWNLTRNFLNANQTKSMLLLNGEGDPSGNGLGFSLIRATQKNGFHPLFPPPKENIPKTNTAAYVQKLYDAEIKRIWYSQRSSLADHGDNFDLQAIYDEYKPSNHSKFIKNKIKDDKVVEPDQVLRITRRVRDKNGILQRKVEVVHDPRIIKAYIRRRKQIEDEMLKNAEVGDILPTTDKELNKIRRKALEEKLANLEKKAKQNKLKKPSKDSIHAAAAAGGRIIDANTVILPDGSYAIGGKGIGKGKSRTRRCASCGAFGHIRTNKACPLYNQTQGGTIPIKGGAPVGATSNSSGTDVPGATNTNGTEVGTSVETPISSAPISSAPSTQP